VGGREGGGGRGGSQNFFDHQSGGRVIMGEGVHVLALYSMGVGSCWQRLRL